jgi:hypothetical protein
VYVYGRCMWLRSVCDKCFTLTYAGAFFQLIIDLMGVFGLCNFMVAWMFRVAGFMFVYLLTVSFRMVLLHCFNVCFVVFGSVWTELHRDGEMRIIKLEF